MSKIFFPWIYIVVHRIQQSRQRQLLFLTIISILLFIFLYSYLFKIPSIASIALHIRQHYRTSTEFITITSEDQHLIIFSKFHSSDQISNVRSIATLLSSNILLFYTFSIHSMLFFFLSQATPAMFALLSIPIQGYTRELLSSVNVSTTITSPTSSSFTLAIHFDPTMFRSSMSLLVTSSSWMLIICSTSFHEDLSLIVVNRRGHSEASGTIITCVTFGSNKYSN